MIVIGGIAMYLYWTQSQIVEPITQQPEKSVIVESEDEEEVIAQNEFVRLWEPVPSQVVSSPLLIRGEAKGTWFFEASFPVRLEDRRGHTLAEGYISTPDEWMTEDFVYFVGQLEFEAPEDDFGNLILMKDNPSGLPEHDDELKVPLNFTGTGGSPIVTNFEECEKAGYPVMESYPRQCAIPDGTTFIETLKEECIITGCSKQVCASEHVTTTCVYEPEYSCLKYAVCETQANGECGWTENDVFKSCIDDLAEER